MKKSRIMRITAMFMALVLVFCLAGCSGGTSGGSSSTGETSTAKESSTAPETSTDTEPEDAGTEEGGETAERPYSLESDELGLQPYDEMVTISTAHATWTANNPLNTGDDWSHNSWYNAYREDLNINVVNDYEIADTDFESRVNMLIASDTLPDFLKVTPVQFWQLQEAGQIQPLTEVYNTYATDLYKEEMGAVDALMGGVTVNGEIMGLPQTGLIEMGMLWTRGDWREKVGIEKDELNTFDGWVKLAKAYIEQDPDGDGKDDTLGFSGMFNTGMYSGGTHWIFNAHHANPGIWFERDGEIVYGSVQPEVKDALAKMAELYQEGIIDPSFASADGAVVQDAVKASEIGIWSSIQSGCFGYQIADNPDVVFEHYSFPSVDDEPALTTVANPLYSVFVVSKNCEHPEAVIKLANFYYEKTWNTTIEEMNLFMSGTDDEGVYHYYRDLNAIGPGCPLEHYKVGEECAAYWAGEKTLDEVLTYTRSSVELAINNSSPGARDTFGPEGAISTRYLDLMDNGLYVMDVYNSVPTETMMTKLSLLEDKEEEAFVRIIMGEDPIDAFDTFVEEWYAQGGEQMTEEMNARFE